mmetsp:Transcript_69579/g.180942  ORF Transcript_69579/g.180942 Transcript_69579/m.180942 type:complete len:281 (+) Transcript_69579:455-1297(+)
MTRTGTTRRTTRSVTTTRGVTTAAIAQRQGMTTAAAMSGSVRGPQLVAAMPAATVGMIAIAGLAFAAGALAKRPPAATSAVATRTGGAPARAVVPLPQGTGIVPPTQATETAVMPAAMPAVPPTPVASKPTTGGPRATASTVTARATARDLASTARTTRAGAPAVAMALAGEARAARTARTIGARATARAAAPSVVHSVAVTATARSRGCLVADATRTWRTNVLAAACVGSATTTTAWAAAVVATATGAAATGTVTSPSCGSAGIHLRGLGRATSSRSWL